MLFRWRRLVSSAMTGSTAGDQKLIVTAMPSSGCVSGKFLLLTMPVNTIHEDFVFRRELKFNSTIIRSKPSRPGGGWISAA